MDNIKITKQDVEKMKLLTDDEIKKLSFHELCMYLDMLEMAEKLLEGEEE